MIPLMTYTIKEKKPRGIRRGKSRFNEWWVAAVEDPAHESRTSYFASICIGKNGFGDCIHGIVFS